MSATFTQQNFAQLDYLYKKVITRKIKSDGLNNTTIISPANETIANAELIRSDQIWSDSVKLYPGPGQPGVPANNVFVQATNIHNRPGIDVVSDLNGRSWNTGRVNWVPPDFNSNFLPIVYHGTTTQNATSTVDYSAYPYVFDYATGILTFINGVPSYLTSGESVFVNGYIYSGFSGLNKLNGDFSASNITAFNTLYTDNFNVINGSTFNYNYRNQSNINTIIATNHEVTNLTTYQSTNNNTTGTINVAYNTLSNINTLSKVSTLDVAYITTTVPSSNVNMSQKNYINANQVASTTVNVDNLASQSSSTINLSATNLTNVANVNVNTGNTLFTNSISTNSGTNINFNSKNLNGIVDLNMSGSLNVNGNFFVINTTTCNTDQFTINNYGTGPALIVNQQNNMTNATVAQFMLNSNTVAFINNKGQTALGGFGKIPPTSLNYDAQLYVNSPIASNQDAVYVQQDNSTYNMLKMVTTSTSSCNVTFTGAGRFGIGTVPTARVHVYHADNTSTELLRLSNPLSNNALVVGADGRVGIGTDPANFTNTLTVKGIIRADNLILGGGAGTTNLITAYGMIAPAGTNFLSFGTGPGNNMDFRDVNIIYPYQIQSTDYGSAGAPAYTFQNNNSTGIFLFDTNNLSVSTGGTEQVRVDNVGNVGIGTFTINNKLSVVGSVGIGTFAGGAMPVAPDTNGLIVAGKVTIGTTTSTNYMDVAGNTAIGTTYAGAYQAPPAGAIIEGSVGIGTYGNNLTNKLSVAGRVAVGTYAANNTQAPDANGMIISGKVGINTSSSVNYVDICGNIGIGTGYGGIRNAPTDGMIIQGNVGIGTYGNNLTNKLNVAGAVSIGSYATVNTAAPNANSIIVSGTLGVGTSTATNKADIAGNVSIGSNYAGIVSSPDSGLTVQGNVGIGTHGANLTNKLSVFGKAAFGDYANTNTPAPNHNSIIVSGTLGVGTSTATNKTDIAGNVSIGSNYAGVVSSPDSGLTVQGNVGIGTHGPTLNNKLNVAGAVSIGSYATINTVAPNPNSLIISGTLGLGTSNATNKADIAGNMSIGSNYAGQVSSPDSGLTVQGNVGIGTYGPTLNNKLNVAGAVSIGSYATNNTTAPNENSLILSGTLGVGTALSTNYVDLAGNVGIGAAYAGQQASPANGAIIQGSVGIGTYGTNLSNKLSVAGAVSIGSYATINTVAPNPNSLIISGTLGLGTSNATNKADIAGNMSIGSNYAGQVSSPDSGLTVQGNVGIGTYGPTLNNKLNVAGAVSIGSYATNNTTAPNENSLILSGTLGVGTALSTNYVDLAGNVGIGAAYAGQQASPANGAIIQGSVGIGTYGTNLSNKLSVAGAVSIGSYATINTVAPNANSLIISGTLGLGTSNATNKADIAGNVSIGSNYAGQVSSPDSGLTVQGNVGIGTYGANLTNKLSVFGKAAFGDYANNNTPAPNANSIILSGTLGVGTSTATNKTDIAGNVSIGSNYAGVVSSPDSGLTVQGNVGIGTYGSTLNNKLNVAGAVSIGSYATINTVAPNPNSLIISGTLGLGTSNATNKADIAGNVSIGSNYAGQVSSPDSGLTVQGNVGIGTYGPTLNNKLNVAGAVSIGSYATNNTTAPNANSLILSGTLGVGTALSTNYIDLAGNVGIGAAYAGQQASPNNGAIIQGSVGIGTYGNNLSNKLNVAGAVSIGSYATINTVAPNANSLIVSGTLGLGTSNATNKADIAGNVSIGSNYAGQVSSPDSGLTVQGNVGIGTYGPTLNNKLNVAGAVSIGSYATNNTTAPNANSLILSGTLGVGTALSTNYVDLAGNVGIGAAYAGQQASPNNGAIIQGSVGIGTYGNNLSNKLNVAGAVSIGSYATINTVAPNANSLIVSGTLGLGTSNATNKADIAGNVSIGSNYAGQVSSPDSGLTVQGNVGIGTYGPTLNNKLNVAGAVSIGSYATNNTTAPNANSIILSGTLGVGTSTATNKTDIAGNVSIGSNYAGVVSSPDSGLTVQGNVGIGTYGPTLNNKLNVAGAVSIGSYATNNTTAPNANSIILSGTLGVGTSTATNKADIAGNMSIGSNYAGQVSSPDSGLTVEGNVGIGTYGPTLNNKLNVAGAVSIGSYATNNTTAPNANSIILSGTLGVGTSTATNKTDIAGNVSIGSNYAGVVSSPDSGLTVQGSVGIGTHGANLSNKLSVAGSVAIGTYASQNIFAGNSNLIISGSVGIGTTAPQYALDVTPYGSGTINTPNLQVSRILTTPGSNEINMSYSTLSNINVINTVNVNASGVVNVATATPTYATSLSSASLVVTGGTSISQNLLVGDTADSTSTTTGSAIISGGVGVAKALNVGTTITAGTSVITPNVTTPSIQSSTNTITMNYNRIIDVDTLVVRSNISVMMTGTGTYSNLPTDLVRIDADTGKILDQYISQNIVRLMGDGTINPALLPVVPSNRSTLLRTSDKVGIGLRNPQQKLHVYGNQCTTGGYVGIGTAVPTSPLHIWDQNGTGGNPIIYVKEAGSVDLLGIYGENSDVTPVMYINGTSNVGINTKPATNSIFALDVTGKMRATTSVRTSALESDSGTINCQNTNFTNMQNVNINYLTVTGSVSLPTTNITTTTTTSVATNTISAATGSSVQMTSGLYITGFDNSLYAASSNFVAGSAGTTNIGLRVNESILAKTIFTISDQRVKTNITFSPSIDDMLAITNIPVHRFNYIGKTETTIGFIAQEVEQYAPYAVTTTSGPIPNIMKYATVAENNASLVVLENHGLNVNDRVKILIDNIERVAKVLEVPDLNTFIIDDPIPTGTSVFVYGIVVDDFKVLENGRLIPLIFNGVKMLNSTVTQQQRIIQDLLVRLNTLETKVNSMVV